MASSSPTTTLPNVQGSSSPMYSFSVADTAASSSGGVTYTSMPNETLSPGGKFAVSVYAYVGIAFLVATFLFGVGYAFYKVRRDRGKKNYDLDNPSYDPNENARYVSRRASWRNSELGPGRINSALANDFRKKRANDAKAGDKSGLEVPNSDPPHPLIRSGSSYGTLSNPTKRVSWASTTSTIQDNDGNAKSRSSRRPADIPSSTRPMSSAYSQPTPISSPPRAQNLHARTNVSHIPDPRALRSRELVGNTTPELCRSWAKPDKAGDGVHDFLSLSPRVSR